MVKPAAHGFWVMLLFAVSLAVVRAIGGSAFAELQEKVGEIVAALIILVPAWFWLQLIARMLKVRCPQCGEWSMRFTGRFPLRRTFHCDACGADDEVPPSGGGRHETR